jgi:hypothetical protein
MNWRERFDLVHFSAVVAERPSPTQWDVEPLIARGNRVVLYGPFASLKSWVLLDLGLCIAAGIPWLGKFSVPNPRAVLYVDEEMARPQLHPRIRRLAASLGLLDAERLPFATASRLGLSLADNGTAEQFLESSRASGFEPDVLIFDSLRRVIGGSELDVADVGRFWRGVEPFARAGKTVILSHHAKKPGPNGAAAPRDRASGSTDILAGADVGLSIERRSRDALVVEQVKSRDAEESEPFVASFIADGKEGPVCLSYEGLARPGSAGGAAAPSELMRAQELALSFLVNRFPEVAQTREIEADLVDSGIAKRTAERAIASLVAQKRVHRSRRGVCALSRTE